MHTREYADFCQRIAGRFIHHQPDPPSEEADPSVPEPLGVPISRAVAAIRAAGFAIDQELWVGAAECQSKCNQCHAGCHDSPTR